MDKQYIDAISETLAIHAPDSDLAPRAYVGHRQLAEGIADVFDSVKEFDRDQFLQSALAKQETN